MQSQNEKNRVEGEKNSLDAYPVQSLEVGSRDVFEVNYSGTSMLITKELYTELVGKATKVDDYKERTSELVQKYNDLLNRFKKLKANHEELDTEAKQLMAIAKKWKAENEHLKRALELEKQAHLATSSELGKFKQAPPPKKAYLSDAERTAISDYMRTHYSANGGQFPKVREIHEWIMREGRARGDRRLANISYETVRATVKDIRVTNGWNQIK